MVLSKDITFVSDKLGLINEIPNQNYCYINLDNSNLPAEIISKYPKYNLSLVSLPFHINSQITTLGMPTAGLARTKKHNLIIDYKGVFQSNFFLNNGELVFQNNQCVGVIQNGGVTPINEVVNHNVEYQETDEMDIDTPDDYSIQIQNLELENDHLRNQYLYLAADFENYKKRQLLEKNETIFQQKAYIIKELLEIIDDFERLIKEKNMDQKIYNQLFYKFTKILNNLGLKSFESQNIPLDPYKHQVLMQEFSSSVEEGHIVNEIKKGYLLDLRLLRPALVSVCKKNK